MCQQVHLAAPNPTVCFLYRGQRLVQQPIDHRNLSMNFARDGVGFINEHAKDDSPFFLYYAFAHMHVNSPSAKPASLLRAFDPSADDRCWVHAQCSTTRCTMARQSTACGARG